jgi:hypothetical protein
MKEIEIPSADNIDTDNHGNAHRFDKVADTLSHITPTALGMLPGQ